MHTLSTREKPVVSLYVKAILYTYDISSIFNRARRMAPCLLILEDIDTLVTEALRSYFFNEVDGLGSNDGIMMVATTNHMDKLDGGLAKRPSRFDRKYLFPIPDRDERILYCEYWRRKLQHNNKVQFPEKLSPAIADITQDFTFAYLKEAFVASLLAIARGEEHDDVEDDFSETISSFVSHKVHKKEDEDIANLPLWILIQKEVKLLREDMENGEKAETKSRPSPHTSARQISLPEAEALMTAPLGMEHLGRMRADFNRRAGSRTIESPKDDFFQPANSRNGSMTELLAERRTLAMVNKGNDSVGRCCHDGLRRYS